jgi:hypothetical protein
VVAGYRSEAEGTRRSSATVCCGPWIAKCGRRICVGLWLCAGCSSCEIYARCLIDP